MNLQPSTQFGQYRVLRLLGRGGMGEVYEVEHTTLARRYALKLLPEDFTARPEALARFRREARVMANLEHPHIVRVDEFGEVGGRHWLRMELVKGVRSPEGSGAEADRNVRAPILTLGDYAAARGGQLEQEEFAAILEQILEALAYAHGKGVVHRDLKPGNILLETGAAGQLVVKVSDFGLARVIGEEFVRSLAQLSVSQGLSLSTAQTLAGRSLGADRTVREEEGTSTRALLGTWEYMSPEQQRGEEADARSDIYAVGLMCYRLLTGKELGLKKPSQLAGGLVGAWDGFVTRAVEQDAAARFEAGAAMLAAFGAVREAVEADARARRQAEEERRAQEAEAARERAEEEALRARGEGWVVEEAQAAKAWQADEERRQREDRARAGRTAKKKPGRFLSAGPGIKFACGHCQQHFEAGREMVGREISCPACGKPTLVPRAPGLITRGWRKVMAAGGGLPRWAWLWGLPALAVLALAGVGGWHIWTSMREKKASTPAPAAAAAPAQPSSPEAGATACLNKLRQLGGLFRTWALDNENRFPFNVARREGGSAEARDPRPDGWDANSAAHFQALSNTIQAPIFLVCPSDAKTPAPDFASLTPAHASYQLRTGPEVDVEHPDMVLLRCPIHNHVALCGGTALDGRTAGATNALKNPAGSGAVVRVKREPLLPATPIRYGSDPDPFGSIPGGPGGPPLYAAQATSRTAAKSTTGRSRVPTLDQCQALLGITEPVEWMAVQSPLRRVLTEWQKAGGVRCPVGPEADALRQALTAKASKAELKQRLNAFRLAQGRSLRSNSLTPSQGELRARLTVEQEARAVLAGLLP
jgi:tRNA A-37 threonylcarbamoyl transferase component Bud32